jgi:uncharacterized membrane-anchored protein YitT (DUF2179 family)
MEWLIALMGAMMIALTIALVMLRQSFKHLSVITSFQNEAIAHLINNDTEEARKSLVKANRYYEWWVWGGDQ